VIRPAGPIAPTADWIPNDGGDHGGASSKLTPDEVAQQIRDALGNSHMQQKAQGGSRGHRKTRRKIFATRSAKYFKPSSSLPNLRVTVLVADVARGIDDEPDPFVLRENWAGVAG
jgi:hypothetical protein